MAKREFTVDINNKFCKACGICVNLCTTKVLGRDDEGRALVVDEAACVGCRNCERHCPDFCIEVFEKKEAEA